MSKKISLSPFEVSNFSCKIDKLNFKHFFAEKKGSKKTLKKKGMSVFQKLFFQLHFLQPNWGVKKLFPISFKKKIENGEYLLPTGTPKIPELQGILILMINSEGFEVISHCP